MKSKYKETDSSNLTASEREEFFRGSLKTIHENKNDVKSLQEFIKELASTQTISETINNVRLGLKFSIEDLPRYICYSNCQVDCMEEDRDGEYIKLEDVLNLFSAKNS